MGTGVPWGSARGNAAGEGNPVIVEGEYLARQGMDWGFSFVLCLKGFCFYCQLYGSILSRISRICKLSFDWGLAVWYVLVVLIQCLGWKANVFILGIPVTIGHFPRRRWKPDGNAARTALLALSLHWCRVSFFHSERIWAPTVCPAWWDSRALDTGDLEPGFQQATSLLHGVRIQMGGKGMKDVI